MERTILTIITAALAYAADTAAQDVLPQSAHSLAAAGIHALNTNGGTTSLNPASATDATTPRINISAHLPYGMTALTQTQAKLSMPLKFASFSPSVTRSGTDQSHITTIGADMARQFKILTIGFGYYAIMHTLPFNVRGRASFSRFGIELHPTTQWTIAAAAHNPERRTMAYRHTTYDRQLQTTLFTAIRYDAPTMISTAVEAEIEKGRRPNIKAATSLRPTNGLTASIGIAYAGYTISAGIGYTRKFIGIHAAISHHAQLGISSAATLSLHIVKDDKP